MADDEEQYIYYGTPLQEEADAARNAVRAAKDPTVTRSAPLHQQEATDEQGRRRFHGAFTGGYSAGYFNTVGSKVCLQRRGQKTAQQHASTSWHSTHTGQRLALLPCTCLCC
jgi:G patch domain-containing protein 1